MSQNSFNADFDPKCSFVKPSWMNPQSTLSLDKPKYVKKIIQVPDEREGRKLQIMVIGCVCVSGRYCDIIYNKK